MFGCTRKIIYFLIEFHWNVASGCIKIKFYTYIIFLLRPGTLGKMILLQFKFETILVGLLCTPLIILYPIMKRITFWPQLFLGIIFNWGVIICSVEFLGSITKEYLFFYLACILWTIGYDTIYAYQDIKDDKKNNIKSTAVLFKDNGKYFVIVSYTLMFGIIGYLSFINTIEIIKLLVYLGIFIYIIIKLIRWNLNSADNSGKKFRQNNLFGAMIFLYLLSF